MAYMRCYFHFLFVKTSKFRSFLYFFTVSFIKTHFKMSNELTEDSSTQKNRGGRPLNSIWEDIQQGASVAPGKFAATCKYCGASWSRGEIPKLEQHLSNHCSEAPGSVVRKYMTKILERSDKPSKKRKFDQQTMDNYHDSAEIPQSRITRINRALIKFFVACGISFRIVEHPFFINLVRELNGGYNPPSREVLVSQLLERELAQVNSKVNSELEKETNLTLGLLNNINYHKVVTVFNLVLLTIYNII